MRKKHEPQTSIFDCINIVDHSAAEEFYAISKRLDSHPEFIDWVCSDIKAYEVLHPDTGRPACLRTACFDVPFSRPIRDSLIVNLNFI